MMLQIVLRGLGAKLRKKHDESGKLKERLKNRPLGP